MSNDYFKAQGWFKNYALNSQDSRGVFQQLVKEDEEAFRLASAESDKIKDMMNEKYGPGTVKYGSEIKQPEMKTPQAIFEFTQRNPAAEGGRMIDNIRPGFYRGESVVKSHGQKLIELTEAGESSVSIAKKLGLKQQTVSNALNAIDSGIAGNEYKLSKPLKDFFKPKNQFSGKELTKNTELIEAIKEDAPTMSDKEIKAKYDIHKSTLKKIKNENDITTRSSYLPEGEQKKSIPYADRYTAEEKSAMYKKRKETETDEDRAKAKERDKKYRDKIYKDYKMEPSSRTPYDDLWKDIARSSKEGIRIQLVDGPKYSSGASYDDFKSRVFLDTKTGETFNYNNLKNYLNSGKLEGVTYDSVIEPYNLKNKIAKSGLKEDIQKAYFGEKYKPPGKFRAQNTFHVHHIGGVAADPFSVQLTFADENLGLVTNKKFNKEWSSLIERNAPLSERKNYLKFVKKQIGDNIAQTLEFPEVNKVRTFGEIGTAMQKLLSNKKFKDMDLKNIDFIDGKKDFVGFSSGFNTDLLMKDPAVQKILNSKAGQAVKNATRGTAGTVGKVFGVADILIGALDYENNISKGQKPKEALGNAVQAMSFNLYKSGDRARVEDVKERFVAKGGDAEIFDQATALNAKDQEINDLIFSNKKKADTFVRYAKEGRGVLTPDLEKSKADYEILKKNLNEEIKNKIQERDNMVESYKTNLRVSEAGAPIQIGGNEFFSQPFKDIKQSTMDKIAEENRKAYDMQKRQVNFTSGNIGNFLQNNIFTMNPQEKAELQRQINNMDERELYKFNLSRGMDPDNLIRFEDLLNIKSSNPDLMGVNTTKYVNYDDRKAEGGIIGLRSKYEYKK